MDTIVLEVNDNEFLRQFETTIENQKAVIEYATQPRSVFLTKLIMDESLIDKGYDELFIKTVFEIIDQRNTRMVPTCPKIASYFKKNRRKYKALLPVGMSL
ncbi:N-acetyltransferase [Aquimarina agarivorans]|uniref:N-acetyltransferase n=1 Tax=Aquimarina agarivorans TaxID=980584 RepID=UPI000248EA52|nr:N-acetyltransferase [Aquimarina agarivorans]